ncbi:MAG TPA: glycosyltransferase, partial [Bacteroidales bacterium]|nr:glycosyltransferase [Bacteroidales bacterium]
MKILMVLDHEFPPDPRVENEINSLTKAGHEIILACYTLQNRPTCEKSGSTNIYRKPISKFIYKSSVGILKFPFYFNFWKSFLDSLSETLEFDAIHIHDLPLAKIGYEFAKKHNIPFVLDLHENWPSLLETSEHANTFLGKILSTNKQW